MKIYYPYLVSLFVIVKSQLPCNIPADHVMQIFSLEEGAETVTDIQIDGLVAYRNQFNALCYSVTNTTIQLPESVTDINVIYKNRYISCPT